jgi:Mycoplasma protein of unknown function, DUF285
MKRQLYNSLNSTTMMLIRTATLFLFCFFREIVSIHAQLRKARKEVSTTSHNEHRDYQRRSPDRVKGRQPKEEERIIALTASSVHTPSEKEVSNNKKDVDGLETRHRDARDYAHRQLMVPTKQNHKQKLTVRAGPYYYKRIELTASDTESELDEHAYYMPKNKASPSNRANKSRNSFFFKASKSQKSPGAEVGMEKRYIPHSHSREGPLKSSNKPDKLSSEVAMEHNSVNKKRVYSSPDIHYGDEPADDVQSYQANRFYKSEQQFSQAPAGAPGTAISEVILEAAGLASDTARRFYSRVRQQRLNYQLELHKASNGPSETPRAYEPFANSLFGNRPVNKTTSTAVLQTPQHVYTPFSDRIFGHVPETDNGYDVTFGREGEVQVNEFTQLDESPAAFPCFSNRMDLLAAVDEYLLDNRANTFLAQTYGWPIGTWCVSQVKSFHAIFSAYRNSAASTFNEDLSNWDVSNATSTQNMFEGSAIDQDFSAWNTSAIKSMNSMFSHTPAFEGKGLSKWDTSSVIDMSFMFSNAVSLREDISAWNVSHVKSTWGMFQFASSFNHDLSPWTLRALVSMDLMFKSATSFRMIYALG